MPKNLRQAINLHIEQVDAPTVRIILPDVSRTADREQEVLFLWSEPVDFSLTTGNPQRDRHILRRQELIMTQDIHRIPFQHNVNFHL